MVFAYPTYDTIDWDVPPVHSGINCALWKSLHAKHCSLCSPAAIHNTCYFKFVHHFLSTGFEPPVDPTRQRVVHSQRRAYVKKWRAEEAGCNKAFHKWVSQCEGLMSDTQKACKFVFSPLLPVVKEKKLIGIITDSDFVAIAITLIETLEEVDPIESDFETLDMLDE